MLRVILDIVYSLKISWKASRFNLSVLFFIQIINGFLPVINIYLFQKTIDHLTIVLKNDGSFQSAIFYLALQIICILLISVIEQINKVNSLYMNQNINKHTKNLMLDKLNKIPFIKFEDPVFYNNLQMITGTDSKIVDNVSQLSSFIKGFITLTSILIYLINIHIMLVIVLIVGIIPYCFIEIRYGNSRYQLASMLIPTRREEGYIMNLLTKRDSIKELRLYKLHTYLVEKWSYFFTKNTSEEIKLIKKQSINIFFAEIITIFTYAIASMIVVFLISTGKIMLGAFIAVIQGIQNIQNSLSQMIKMIAALYENSLYIRLYQQFFDEDEIVSEVNGLEINNLRKVEVRNLSFTYPNTDKPVLKNISLSIKPKKKIAIIGLNGAGKTTLIKCLMGLYPTRKGSIFVNDICLNNINLESYHSRISVLFQDFERFHFSLRENIGFGNIEDLQNTIKLTEIINSVGLDEVLAELPKGVDNRLGRMFEGGSELSGGQWQKVAIARSLFRNSDLIVLDEPTSALDPKAEVDMMEEVFKLYEEKAVVYITHRLGVACNADEILVIKDGAIVESGTHIELMNLKGEYSKLYKAQSAWYTNKNIGKTFL
ncbi:ABC transporter ATP-binding protein [Bacillus toyonensis]|uniref:ABC transporter ATP-binding protein n=1 Tax=Bacillus toyonensis TaxID=155322 RepID=UPI003CE8BA0A